jgi:hypothetical protein
MDFLGTPEAAALLEKQGFTVLARRTGDGS